MSAKDIFFISSNDINDGHREDSASVNAQAHSKIRRRKWNVRFECGSDPPFCFCAGRRMRRTWTSNAVSSD